MSRVSLVGERLARSAGGIVRMIRLAGPLADSRRSYAQLVVDTFTYRILRFSQRGLGVRRRVRVGGGVTLTYRADRGDIRALAETWMARAYDLPVPVTPGGVILDLGANIGLTAAFLAHRYRPSLYVAVEPVPANAELVRVNLKSNGVPSRVFDAAIGPSDGEATFQEADDSTQGALGNGSGGRQVRVVSVPTALADADPNSRISLVKMDIEGGEEWLFSDNLEWLDRVDCLVAELHPDLCDVGQVRDRLAAVGLREHRLEVGEPQGEEYMAYFVRDNGAAPTAQRSSR